jgi:hypothetical protein
MVYDDATILSGAQPFYQSYLLNMDYIQKQADNNSVRMQPYIMKSHIEHSTIMTQPYCQVRNHIFNPMYSD